MENHALPALEAVIFAGGEPVSTDRLAETLEMEPSALQPMLEALAAKYDRPDSGIRLVQLEDAWQICTKAEYAAYVRRAFEIRRNAPLSQAALEVLAVVAYNQPVTKSFVEQVRGVDCSGVIASLGEKGLLEEKGRLELPGRPLLYGTTPNFLRCFGLRSLADLPPLPDGEEPQAEQLEILQDTGAETVGD